MLESVLIVFIFVDEVQTGSSQTIYLLSEMLIKLLEVNFLYVLERNVVFNDSKWIKRIEVINGYVLAHLICWLFYKASFIVYELLKLNLFLQSVTELKIYILYEVLDEIRLFIYLSVDLL